MLIALSVDANDGSAVYLPHPRLLQHVDDKTDMQVVEAQTCYLKHSHLKAMQMLLLVMSHMHSLTVLVSHSLLPCGCMQSTRPEQLAHALKKNGRWTEAYGTSGH